MPIRHADQIPPTAVEAGTGASMQVLIDAAAAPHFAMRRFRIEPGGYMPSHTNEVEHEQYVLAGRALVGIDGQVYRVQPGDAVLIPAHAPHWYRTEGDEAFVFLCLVPNLPDEIKLVG